MVPGYFSAWQILQRMRKDGLVKPNDIPVPGAVDIWTLPNTKVPRNWFNREHELDCADVFVALYKTGIVDNWDSHWTDDETKQIAEKYGVYYDRRIVLEGFDKVIFLEVDRGTEEIDVIANKVKKYIKLHAAFPREKFVVLFTVQGYKGEEVKARVQKMIKGAIHGHQQNDLFLLTPHEPFLEDPLGAVCISPNDWDKPVTLL